MEEEELNKEIENLKRNNKKTDVNPKDMENLIVEDTKSSIINNNQDTENNDFSYKKSKKDLKNDINSLAFNF